MNYSQTSLWIFILFRFNNINFLLIYLVGIYSFKIDTPTPRYTWLNKKKKTINYIKYLYNLILY